MLYLIAIATVLALYGFHRTLMVLIALFVTVASFMLANGLALILTFIFTDAGGAMNTWTWGGFPGWTNDFISNASFSSAPLVIFVFAADCVRAWLWVMFNHLNLFFIVMSVLWIYISACFWTAAARNVFSKT